MKILFDIGHPAHVHYFRNLIRELERKGHIIAISARDKEITRELLEAYGFKYTVTDKNRKGLSGKIFGLVKNDIAVLNLALKFRPDLFVSTGTPYAAHASRLSRKKHIIFTDTEVASIVIFITFPFTDIICTPDWYLLKLNPKKHLKFNGFLELAYLHPNYFKPNKDTMTELGLNNDEKFFILRFVSWEASHDIGHKGFSLKEKRKLIELLNPYGRVIITSESPLPPEFEKYRIQIAPEKIHDTLYFASMYVGEGATMATESGLLGTPSILINPLVRGLGNFVELEKHGIVHSFRSLEEAFPKIKEILTDKESKNVWRKRSADYVAEKIDVTKWMVERILKTL